MTVAGASLIPFNVVAKPVGPRCNLDCKYCFYKHKGHLLQADGPPVMSPEILERFIEAFIDARHGQDITFYWQGGEPCLAGVEFFEKAVALQKRHAPRGMRIHNAIQTNGTLLDECFCRFLADNSFLVGLSIDGPPPSHDCYRRDHRGNPSHRRVVNALQRLHSYGVPVNSITVVHQANVIHPRAVYEHLKELGLRHMQFIPLVEHHPARAATPGPRRRASRRSARRARVTHRCAKAEEYGAFMCEIFDLWLASDVGRTSVQTFDALLARALGSPAGVCTQAETCGDVLVLEHNGDVYACDHYVQPQHRLGNISSSRLSELFLGPTQRAFAAAKHQQLPRQCRLCRLLPLCRGGCPKDRFVSTADGEPTLNYLCVGYRRLYEHAWQPIRRLAAALNGSVPAGQAATLAPALDDRLSR